MGGGALLLMFVYGGVLIVWSAGSQEKVSKGKQVISGGVIGLLFVLGSWLIINWILLGLRTENILEGEGQIFDQPFNQTPQGQTGGAAQPAAPAGGSGGGRFGPRESPF